MSSSNGRARVVIEGVKPEIDGGQFAIKRVIGEEVAVQADIFTDGHDSIAAVLLHRKESDSRWQETPMTPLVNDRWQAAFPVTELGRYCYTLIAWVDAFKTWRLGFEKKVAARQDVAVDLLIGAQLIEATAQRADSPDRQVLEQWVEALQSPELSLADKTQLALNQEISRLVAQRPDREHATSYPRALPVIVDPKRARFSSWYELFPRSCSPTPGRHGTFKDCEGRLPYIAAMGFDVVYLPPIHPIGRAKRKGKNNAIIAQPGDVGSPWAIGGPEGGHKAIHPELGTLEDFQQFITKAKDYGIDVALDIAFQCSPDHPYVKEHRQWFRQRPDGTVQYAENPPKRYEDIYPFDFDSPDWENLWKELKSVFTYWINQGVHIFRVDNPHTKAFPFWEWAIGEIKAEHPDIIFLAEAFTRPKVMYRLAKLGFSQSYTYFAWRNLDWELTQYFTELTQTEAREFFRPNLWPNTPDILTEYLQTGGLPAFRARLALAATLGASYGIYGPAFELGEALPREPGSEEYLNSEKYQIREWQLSRPDSLKEFIALVNRIRRENPALHSDWSLRFHPVDNSKLICYSKQDKSQDNTILTVVNLDPHHVHFGWVNLDLQRLGIGADEAYQAHDLLTNARYQWNGPHNFVRLDPASVPAHIFRLERRARTERDFDYYM